MKLFDPAIADRFGELVITVVGLTLALRAVLSGVQRYRLLSFLAVPLQGIHWKPIERFVKYIHADTQQRKIL